MNGEGRTTITVSRPIKDRFLDFIGAPKKYRSADEAMAALLDNFEHNQRKSNLEETGDGVQSG